MQTIKNPIRRRSILSATALLLALTINSADKASAQCLTSNLDITTGNYHGSVVAQGSSDPLWYCVNKTGNFAGGLPAAGSNALVVVPTGTWAGGGTWISDNQVDANPGIVTTVTSDLTFERRFSLCSDDSVTFNLNIRSDGFVTDILVDGVSQGLSSFVGNWGGGPLFSPSFTKYLTAGGHTLQLVIDEPPQYFQDPVGFYLNGNLTSSGSSIVDDQNANCEHYTCAPRCDDKCYWTVDGNNIASGRNIFGTLTKDDVRIQTTATNRGILTADGKLGWNTMAPSTLMHVQCTGAYGAPSDIRFENLPRGRGMALVVDPAGYVYVSQGLQGMVAGNDETQSELSTLKEEVSYLKQELARMKQGDAQATDVFVYPNPAKNNLDIRILSSNGAKATSYSVVDMQGRQVLSNMVPGGKGGEFNIDINTLAPGTYIISLASDSRVIAKKEFVVGK